MSWIEQYLDRVNNHLDFLEWLMDQIEHSLDNHIDIEV
jgi:hypothetical protein